MNYWFFKENKNSYLKFNFKHKSNYLLFSLLQKKVILSLNLPSCELENVLIKILVVDLDCIFLTSNGKAGNGHLSLDSNYSRELITYFSLSSSLSDSFSLLHTHTHTHTQTYSFSCTLSHTHTHIHIAIHHIHTPSLAHTVIHTQTISLSFFVTYTHTHKQRKKSVILS